MSIQVVEQLGSRSVSRQQGKLKATRSFHVWDDTSPLTTPDAVGLLFGTNGLPRLREIFPGSRRLRAQDWTISLVSGHKDLWLVTWEYAELNISFATSGAVTTSNVETPDASTPGYSEVNATFSASHVDIWRAFSRASIDQMCSANGSHPAGMPNPGDIGGQPVDSGGRPPSYIVRQYELTISVTRFGTFEPASLVDFVWTRNAGTFLDCPPGSLLYCGATVNRVGPERYQYAHKFVYDQYYHMRQSPASDNAGNIMLTPQPPPPGPPVPSHAILVEFIQPFPDLQSFALIDPLILKYT